MAEHNLNKIEEVSQNAETFFVLSSLSLKNLKQCIEIENSLNRDSSSRTERDIEDFLTKYSTYGLFNKDKELVSFIVFSIIDDSTELIDFGVSNKHQKQGIGFKTLDHSLQILKSKNIKEVILEVSEINIPAINLYDKFNTEQIGIRKNYYLNKDKTKSSALVKKIIL